MRKIALIVVLISFYGSGFAQSKLGLKFSPAVSSNRVSLIDTTYNASKGNNVLKFSLGLIYDHEFSENYYFSTGLIFVPTQVAFHAGVEREHANDATYSGNSFEAYRLNYLQIPVTLKLYTNEIQPDTRVYFQVGMAPEIKVFEEPKKETYNLITKFRALDAPVILGCGVEYRAGLNTTLFGGITYQRGLVNVVKSVSYDFQNNLKIFNSYVALDLGIKF